VRWPLPSSPALPSHDPLPPSGLLADGEAHLPFQGAQVEPDHVGEPALEHEVRHAARELPGLVGVAAEADRQLALQDVYEQGHEAGLGFDYMPGIGHER